MPEYIERSVALLSIEHEDPAFKYAIERVPTADVQEVRHGRWISNNLGGYKWAYYCSECGWVDGYPFNNRHNYCPNCGAKMDGKENGNNGN